MLVTEGEALLGDGLPAYAVTRRYLDEAGPTLVSAVTRLREGEVLAQMTERYRRVDVPRWCAWPDRRRPRGVLSTPGGGVTGGSGLPRLRVALGWGLGYSAHTRCGGVVTVTLGGKI